MVICQGMADDRCSARRCICAQDRRQQVETGFVHKHQGALFLYGFFLTSGQRSCFHRWMAASFRWVARRTGFWGLQPQSRRMRLTWDRWYETPKVRRMTWAIRPQVQMSPLKPKASAPRFSSWGMCALYRVLRRDGAPVGLRRLSASTPPSLARFTHWLTAPLLTPNASAMSFCFHPACFSSQPRSRRPSRQSMAQVECVLLMHSIITHFLISV